MDSLKENLAMMQTTCWVDGNHIFTNLGIILHMEKNIHSTVVKVDGEQLPSSVAFSYGAKINQDIHGSCAKPSMLSRWYTTICADVMSR